MFASSGASGEVAELAPLNHIDRSDYIGALAEAASE